MYLPASAEGPSSSNSGPHLSTGRAIDDEALLTCANKKVIAIMEINKKDPSPAREPVSQPLTFEKRPPETRRPVNPPHTMAHSQLR